MYAVTGGGKDRMKRLGDVLAGLRPQIPESLLAGEGWDRLVARVGGLPASAACGFELRLGAPGPSADFSLAVGPEPVAKYYIARGERADPASPEAWLKGYLTGETGTGGWIEGLLLGYDLVDDSGECLADLPPAVNLRLAPTHRLRQDGVTPELLGTALAHAVGHGDGRRERKAVGRAFDALPSGASIVFAAVAPDRPKTVKLVISKIPAADAGAFAARLGWTGSVPAISELLYGMRDVSSGFMVSIDLTAEGALPGLGLEIYPEYTSDSRDDGTLLTTWLRTTARDWRDLTDRLVSMKLCLPAKARGLLSWPKRTRVFGETGVYGLYMGINHVKIIVDGEDLSAKAYAGLQLLPIAR